MSAPISVIGPPTMIDDEQSSDSTLEVISDDPEAVLNAPAPLPQVAPGGPIAAPPTEASPRKRHSVALAVLIAVILLGASVIWYYVARTNTSNFSAEISSYGLVPVNFASSGVVSKITVHDGETVRRGKVLAYENDSTATATLQRDRTQLRADQSYLSQLQGIYSSAGSASQAQLSSSADSETNAVNAAQQSLQVANTAFSAELSQAQQNLQADNTALATEQSAYSTQCPSGTNGPGPTLTLAQCISLYGSVQSAQSTVNSQNQQILAIQADQRVAISDAQRNLASAQAAQANALGGQSLSTASSVQIAAAQNQVQKDQAQLKADQSSNASMTLVAPVSGTIAQIDGSVGLPVDSLGVQGVQAQSNGVPANATQSFFPSLGLQPVNSSSSEPMLVLRTHQPFRVIALIPEAQISQFAMNSPAVFIPSLKGIAPVNLRVTQIGAFPVVSGGTANYSVTFALSGSPQRGYLQGLTGVVRSQ